MTAPSPPVFAPETPLRVLHVLDHSLPLHSGYTFRTRAIMTAQAVAGMAVCGVTGLRHRDPGDQSSASAGEEHDGLTFYRTTGATSRSPGLAEWQEAALLADRIVAVANAWGAQVIHAHSPALCGLAAVRAGGRLGLPVVYEIRAFWEDAAVGNGTGSAGSLRYWLTRGLENAVIARADALITICDGLKQALVARGVGARRITVVPNGIDRALFGTPAPRDRALAETLDLGAGPVIGYIGSFYPYEGVDDLIAAMPAITAAVPDARLLLVGGGPAEAAWRAAVEASPARAAIRMVGRVPHHQAQAYYALADVMCYPRKSLPVTETVTPLKPLEAMAQGTLVAASAVGGHRELIENGRTGTLFAPDDPASLAAAMIGLLTGRDGWPARREAARAHVLAHHDWACNVAHYRPVYLSVLGDTGISVRVAA